MRRVLLISTCLVFISCFHSVSLRKSHRGLEYKCLFYRLYLFFLRSWLFVLKLRFLSVFTFAFLIIYVRTFRFRQLLNSMDNKDFMTWMLKPFMDVDKLVLVMSILKNFVVTWICLSLCFQITTNSNQWKRVYIFYLV